MVNEPSVSSHWGFTVYQQNASWLGAKEIRYVDEVTRRTEENVTKQINDVDPEPGNEETNRSGYTLFVITSVNFINNLDKVIWLAEN